MTIEDKLGLDRFHTDELNSHIQVDKENPDPEQVEILRKACPAGLYKVTEAGKLTYDHLGCLECGTCRVLSGGKVVKGWDYPLGSFGVEFRLG